MTGSAVIRDRYGAGASVVARVAVAVLVGCVLAAAALMVGARPAAANWPWTAQTAAEANNWESVTYGNGVFVAVATSGTHRVMTSPDGVTWTAQTAAGANYWESVTYGNGVFVAVATDGNYPVMTSFAADAPTVTGVAPNHGPVAGGTPVTVTGTGFDPAATASVGASAAP